MCQSEDCLIIILILTILSFGFFIYFLLKVRKSLLDQDATLSGQKLWNHYKTKVSPHFQENDFLFSYWQDINAQQSKLIIKNSNNQIIAETIFNLGHREHRVLILGSPYLILNHVTLGGSNFTIQTHDGRVLAQLIRKTLRQTTHTLYASETGEIQARQIIFDFYSPIQYKNEDESIAITYQLSAIRRIGRAGYFSQELSLPTKILILSLTS